MTASDCRNRLFIPESEGGQGFISMLDQDVISNGRELEIGSNLPSLDGISLRTRICAMNNYSLGESDANITNHMKFAIEKLARFGLFFQDRDDDLVNNILAKLNENGKFPSIGSIHYKDGTGYSIGSGKSINLNLAYGGPIHSCMVSWKRNNWIIDDNTLNLMKLCKIKKNDIIKIRKEVIEERFNYIAGIYSFWEWRNNSSLSLREISKNNEEWKFVNVPEIFRKKISKTYQNFNDITIKKEAAKIVQIGFWNSESLDDNHLRFNPYNFFHKLMRKIISTNTPFLISTDGAHDDSNSSGSTHSTTTSAFVLSICDIKNDESIQSGEWKFRPTIPIFSRAMKLPSHIGNTPSDIATGELFAIALSELSLPSKIPRIIITDSKSTRDLLLKLRDSDDGSATDRGYIRSISGGVSKFIFNLFQEKFLGSSDDTEDIHPDLLSSLQKTTSTMNLIAKSWLSPSKKDNNEEINQWEPHYWDSHQCRSVWKINSHQLNEFGNARGNKSRYTHLIPNLSILSCNHHADVSADYVKTFHQTMFNIKVATSRMRFSLIWGGKSIDRHISNLIRDKIAVERIRRLQTKPTQGLLWRISPHSSESWETFRSHRGLFRSLLGLSRTHTRCLYKNEVYRENCHTVMMEQSMEPAQQYIPLSSPSKFKLIERLSPCMWCASEHNGAHNEKGNRKHANLHCTNPHISMFREDINKLINHKMKTLLMDMNAIASWKFTSSLLFQIEQKFLYHQSHQTGRLKFIPHHRNNSYLSIADLLHKWNKPNLFTAIDNDECYILTDILGLSPSRSPYQKGDEELGLIDSTWLGLVPNFLNETLIYACNQFRLSIKSTSDTTDIAEHLHSSWRAIKALILGRVVGLHRVIGSTGKEFEKLLQIKDNSQDNNNGVEGKTPIPNIPIKRSIDFSASHITTPTPIKKRKILPIINENIANATPSPPSFSPPPSSLSTSPSSLSTSPSSFSSPISTTLTQSRSCSGISCGKEASFWCKGCNFEKNVIKANSKQCQRCGKYMTAMNKVKTILDKLQSEPTKNSNMLRQIISLCNAHNGNTQVRYISLMDLLYSSFPQADNPMEAKYTS